jgi:hypothetical protein
MLAGVMKYAPDEACGLVAGNNNVSSAVFEIPNILHHSTSPDVSEDQLCI